MIASTSPYNLFQERYRDEPWHLLCCVICLNLCTGAALESVHEALFERWPSAFDMAFAEPIEVELFVGSLGLQRRRARNLIRMSIAYAFLWDGRDPTDLPGIGKYGSDSYMIFVRKDFSIKPQDKELKKYLSWLDEFPKL